MIKVGQKLYEERIKKGLSLEEVAKATKIRVSFLQAIEKGDYKKLPSSAYIQGFVRNYAQYLGLPQKEFLALFRREFNEKEYIRVLPEGFARKEDIPIRQFRMGQKGILIISISLVFLAYIAFQYRYAFINPPLSVVSPEEGKIYSPSIQVTGSTDSNATVFVNETPVTVDKNGKFQKNITVFPGEETIIVKSQSRFGKYTQIERRIVVKE